MAGCREAGDERSPAKRQESMSAAQKHTPLLTRSRSDEAASTWSASQAPAGRAFESCDADTAVVIDR